MAVKQNPDEQTEPRHSPKEAFDRTGGWHDNRMPGMVPIFGWRRVKMGKIRHRLSFLNWGLVFGRTTKTNCA
jgi:hypothetical protein